MAPLELRAAQSHLIFHDELILIYIWLKLVKLFEFKYRSRKVHKIKSPEMYNNLCLGFSKNKSIADFTYVVLA